MSGSNFKCFKRNFLLILLKEIHFGFYLKEIPIKFTWISISFKKDNLFFFQLYQGKTFLWKWISLIFITRKVLRQERKNEGILNFTKGIFFQFNWSKLNFEFTSRKVFKLYWDDFFSFFKLKFLSILLMENFFPFYFWWSKLFFS